MKKAVSETSVKNGWLHPADTAFGQFGTDIVHKAQAGNTVLCLIRIIPAILPTF